MKPLVLGSKYHDEITGLEGTATVASVTYGNVKYIRLEPNDPEKKAKTFEIQRIRDSDGNGVTWTPALTYPMGLKMKDKLTDFEGALVEYQQHLYGCVLLVIEKWNEEKGEQLQLIIDEARAERVDQKPLATTATSGPICHESQIPY